MFHPSFQMGTGRKVTHHQMIWRGVSNVGFDDLALVPLTAQAVQHLFNAPGGGMYGFLKHICPTPDGTKWFAAN